jgi:hypothetical protein
MHLCRCLLLVASLVVLTASLHANDDDIRPSKQPRHGGQVRFTPNRGQIIDMEGKLRPDVLYTADVPGVRLFFRHDGISYVFTKQHEPVASLRKDGFGTGVIDASDTLWLYRMDMQLLNANPHPRITATDQSDDYTNYYLPHCPDGITRVPAFGTLTYHEVYPGIDMVVHSAEAGVKYEFIVQPGADPERILLRYAGARKLQIDHSGRLQAETALGNIEEAKPYAYQTNEIPVGYAVTGDTVRFALGEYDHGQQLVIDPLVRAWATYFGGNAQDIGWGIAVKGNGSSCLYGMTFSTNLPVTTGAFQATHTTGSNRDLFVARFTSSGARLWATYYGGSGEDDGQFVSPAIDSSGNVIITGNTASSNFPVSTNAFQTSFAGGLADAFVVKFDSNGARIWGTYLGGGQGASGENYTPYDFGSAVAVEQGGMIVVVGNTFSTDFPVTTGAFQTSYGGNSDAFVTRFTSNGLLLWSTYIGGNTGDGGHGVAVSPTGNIFVAGQAGANFPITTGAYQTTTTAGTLAAVVINLDTAGQRVWATYYGGNNNDGASNIELDSSNNVVICGEARSTNLPTTVGAFQRTHGGSLRDGFVATISSDGSRLLWGTYLGGSSDDRCYGLAVDRQGTITITGETQSTNFPVSATGYQTGFGGVNDAFLTRFTLAGQMLWSTYYGGAAADDANGGVGLDSMGSIYFAGHTRSTNFPVTIGAFRTANAGFDDATLVKFACNISMPSITRSGILCEGDTTARITLTANTGYHTYRWSTGDSTRSASVRSPGIYRVTVMDSVGCFITSDTINIAVRPRPVAAITASAVWFCPEGNVTLTAPFGFLRYRWSTGDSARIITARQPGVYRLVVTDSLGCVSLPDSVTLRTYPSPQPTVTPATTALCLGDTATLSAPQGYVSYRWSNGATTRTIRTGTTGSYSVEVIDTNGCRGTSPAATVKVNQPPTVSIFPVGPVSLCAGDSIRINAPAGLVSYRWSNGATTAAITLRTAGTYSVVGIDTNGCRDSARFILNVNPLPAPTISVDGARQQSPGVWAVCEGEPATLSAGTFYDYRWNTGSSNEKLTVTQPGRYSVVVTAPSGCKGISDTIELVIQKRPDASFTGPSALCVGSSAIYSVQGQPGVRYTWSVTGGTVTAGTGTQALTVRWPNAGAGSVRLVAVDSLTGCTSRDSITVDVGNSLTPVVRTSRSPLLCGGDSVTLDAGAGYRSWRWSTGETTRSITVSTPGDYTVMVEDSSGCSGTSLAVKVRIQPPLQPTISALGSTSFCEGDSVRLDGGAGYSDYEWSTGERTRTITVKNAGSYTVTVTDTAGCTGTSATINISVNGKPAPTISGPNSVCEHAVKNYSVAAIAGSSYVWSVTAGGAITAGQNTPTITVQWGTSGNEQVNVKQTTAEGCAADATAFNVEIGTSLHPSVTPSSDVWRCDGDSVELVAADGYTSYQWSSGEKTRSIIVKAGGTYRVTVDDGGGCSGESDVVRVQFNPNPVPAISPAGPITICDGDSLTLDAGLWAEYLWSTGATTRTITVKQPGNYSVSVVDANGCRGASQPVGVTIAPAPAQPTIAQRGDTLISSPALSYQWIHDGIDIPGATAQQHVITQPGSYRVRISDASGCSATSDPFTPDAEAATATAFIGVYEAAPGQQITIPIELVTPRNLQRNAIRTFRAQMRFNRSLLLPTGSEVTSTLDNDYRTVTLSGTVDPVEGQDTLRLGAIEFIAMLGNAVETPLELVSLEWEEGRVALDTTNGKFRLVGLCQNGGTRLVNTSGNMSLKPMRPNPTGGLTVIEYEVIETGPTRLYLTDMSGSRIMLVDTWLEAGHYMASFDASAIASGTYVCVLQTETLRLTQPLVVEH